LGWGLFFPSLPLEVGLFKIQLKGLQSAVSSPSGVCSGAPAEIEFPAFQLKMMRSGGNLFIYLYQATRPINIINTSRKHEQKKTDRNTDKQIDRH